ncbi:MAG: hypothetical protein HY758_05000 [Nitrospirae bacterium]|nr:hypothetical protein [Nitrospirota bacterium]
MDISLKTILILFISLNVIGCMSAPLPRDVTIIPPSPDVPPNVSAFSGSWQGKWGGSLDGKLIVERIDSKTADIIISWGAMSGVDRGYLKAKVPVLSGPTLEYEDNINKWTFRMNNNLRSIEGEILEKAVSSKMTVTMEKIKN